MDSPPGHDPYAALRFGNYRLFAAGNIFAVIGAQMLSVSVGWELYQQTNSATALGLVGLVQAIPVLLLSILTGQIADHFSRRNVILAGQIVLVFSGTALGLFSLFHDHLPMAGLLQYCNTAFSALARQLGERHSHFDSPYIPILYAILLINGTVRAFNQPAKSAFLTQLIPTKIFSNAVTWNVGIFESCSVIGPALGGALIAILLRWPGSSPWAYPAVYFFNAFGQFVQFATLLPVRVVNPPRSGEPLSLHSLSAGIRYVFNTKIILATITLDLFAVILGGATALLPIYARDILQVGPGGLGWLRAAPAFGAVLCAAVIAHRPPMKHAGRNLLGAVVGFGLATILFGLSRNFGLSFFMLLLAGGFDNISVVVRHTLVQVLTPENMRGRVSAVNSVFIGSSDQLGSLESGLTAAAFGAVASVVVGGIGAIAVVALAAVIWPELRKFGELHSAAIDG